MNPPKTPAVARHDSGATPIAPAPKNAPKRRSFRLTAMEPKEAQIQAALIDWLRVEQAQGRVVWFARLNGGLALQQGRPVRNYRLYLPGEAERHRGYADLHGMLRGGRYFALEVKRHGQKPTAEQQAFLATVRMGGGIGAVVTNFDDAKAILEAG